LNRTAYFETESYKEYPMAEFMLFVRLGDYPERSPEEMQRIVQKYSEWSRKLKAGGNLKAGDEFESTGRILTKKQ